MNKIIDNITTLYVFVMTCIISFLITVVQSVDVDLMGKNLFVFLFGFWGSVLCIIIRFVLLYFKALQQRRAANKIFMILYLTIASIIFMLRLIVVLRLSDFSFKHYVLSYYSRYQFFMLELLISQWLSAKIFIKDCL